MFASTEFWFPLKKYAFQQTKPTLPHIQQLYWKGGGGGGGGNNHAPLLKQSVLIDWLIDG